MKYLLILFYSIFYTIIIHGQIVPGEVGSKWIFGTHGFNDDYYDYTPDEYCYNDTLTITKDTIIGDTNFKKIVGYESYELLNFDDNKISFYKNDSLYTYMDANANVGDTIIVTQNYIPDFFNFFENSVDTFHSLGYVIKEIDSIDINNSQYLRQKVEPLSGYLNENIYNYHDFGDLIYPFGSVYISEEPVSFFQMSMLGGIEFIFINSYFYSYLKYYETKEETIVFFEDESECPMTNLEELSQLKVSIFPNPISETLFINDDLNQLQNIALYDTNSKKLIEIKKQSKSTKLDLSELQPGLYLLHLTTKNGEIEIQKLCKQ